MNAILVALLVALIWGISPIVYKHVLTNISATSLMIINGAVYAIGILILAVTHQQTLRKDLKALQPKHIAMISLTSIISAIIANYLYFHALQREKSYIVSALIATYPLITVVLAAYFLHEPVTMKGFVGVVMIIMGIYLLSIETKTT